MDNLSRDAAAAIKAGMTYGKYMAMKKPVIVKQPEPDGTRRECPCCGKVFYQKNRKTKIYCSEECQRITNKPTKPIKKTSWPQPKICPVCGKEFMADSYRRKHCSPFCSRVAQSENVKRHMAKKKDAAKDVKINEEG